MELTPRLRFLLKLQHTSFVLLLLAAAGLLAWLSTRYVWQADWTLDNRHSLSQASSELLAQLPGPVSLTAYASPASQLREPIAALVEKYRRAKPDVSLRFVDPASAPGEVRAKDINSDGELLIEYQGRAEHSVDLTEQGLSQALQRVLRQEKRWVMFLEGHGERNPLGQANHDYGYLGQHLKSRGFQVQPLSLAQTAQIPDNAALLVLAGPQMDWLPGEVALLTQYLEKGGNLLWLLDPGPAYGLGPLAQALGLNVQPGVLADPASSKLLSLLGGGQNQAMLLVNEYGQHPLTRKLPPNMLALFPEAAGLRVDAPAGWEKTVLFQARPQSWAETGDRTAPAFDAGQDAQGPFDLGVALSRSVGERQQRVALVGDGDFLANTYLENGGNLELGLRLFNWLAQDDALLSVPAKIASDQSLHLPPAASILIAFGFLVALPLGLLAAGLAIWYRRRNA